MLALADSYWSVCIFIQKNISFLAREIARGDTNAGVYRNAIGISHASTADFSESTVILAFLDPRMGRAQTSFA